MDHGERWEGGITMGQEGPFGNDESVHYLDCGNGFIGVCIC